MENNLFLTKEMASKLNDIVQRLRHQLDAHCIVLTDTSGLLLASYQRENRIEMESLAALVGGHVGVVSRIASSIFEENGFEFNLHEGQNYGIVIAKIAKTFLLGVAYHRSLPTGKVRLLTIRIGEELATLAQDFNSEMAATKKLNKNFSSRFSKQFDKLIPKEKVNEYQIEL